MAPEFVVRMTFAGTCAVWVILNIVLIVRVGQLRRTDARSAALPEPWTRRGFVDLLVDTRSDDRLLMWSIYLARVWFFVLILFPIAAVCFGAVMSSGG